MGILLIRKGYPFVVKSLSRLDWRLTIAAVTGLIGLSIAAVGLLPALLGYASLFKWGMTLVVLSAIGAALLRLNGAKAGPRVGSSEVAPRHASAARNVVKTWPQVSTACGLGRHVAVAQREWVPERGGLSDIIATGGRWVDRGTKRELQPLRLVRVRSCGRGLMLDIATPAGVSPANVERAAPGIAHHYGARGWDLAACAEGVALVLLDGSDPLRATVAPSALGAVPTLAGGVPVAVGEGGQVVRVPVMESNLLIAGIPGSGKSGTQTTLLAGLAALSGVALIGFDPKRVELSPWCARFSAVYTNCSQMAEPLRRILAEIDRRYGVLQSEGRKKWTAADGPILAVVVDELAMVTATGDRKADSERADLLRQIVAVGRAAGCFVSLATQKPSSDVVPTSLRDLIAQRAAMRCTTREQAQTVLGGVEPEVLAAVTAIPHELRGVGIFTTESGEVVRARAAWIADETVAGIVEECAHLRVDLPWLSAEVTS